MPIAFLCQYCGRRLEHPRSTAGQEVTCACGMATIVPRPNTAAKGQPQPQPQPASEPIAFNCPHCRKRLRAKATTAGKTVRCVCGTKVTVPAPKARAKPTDPPAEAPPSPKSTGTISLNCNHCRKRHTVSADLAGQKGRCDCGLSYVVPAPSALEAKKAQAAAQAAAKAQARAEAPKAPPRKSPGEQVVFNCPRCKRRIALPVLQAGRKANCGCGARFVIPTRGGRRPTDLAAPAPVKTT